MFDWIVKYSRKKEASSYTAQYEVRCPEQVENRETFQNRCRSCFVESHEDASSEKETHARLSDKLP